MKACSAAEVALLLQAWSSGYGAACRQVLPLITAQPEATTRKSQMVRVGLLGETVRSAPRGI